ncbi:VanZ family protein [Psychroflexus salis]|uniref:VanZ-like domain-containing protein n=1 Tax=Psychroflexus salis TaxID=1526574 RepID=A0A916ZMC2_9FLAO|nr:VanZ family protein [Psychroflexus salis]GGE04768.1 hypothetical protein GCM10010831_02970 [Psychroflexus salis]
MPTQNLPSIQIEQADKFYHLIAYIFLAGSWFTYFVLFKSKQDKISLFIISSALILFGIVIEVLQTTLTDYRTFDVWDIISNTTGVLLVNAFFMLNKNKLRKLKHQLNV